MTRTLYGGVVLWAVLATTLHAIHGGASPLLPGVLAPQDGVDGPTGAPDNYLYVSSKDPNRPLLDSALAFIQSSMRLCNITEEVVNGRPALCDLPPAIAAHNVTYPCMASLDGGLIDTQASAELNQNVLPVYIPLIAPLAAMVAANPSWTELEGPTGVESLYETYGLPIPFGLKGWNTDKHFGLLFKGYYSFFIRQVRSMTDLSSLNGLVSPAQMVQYQTDMNAGRLWIDHHQQEREWWGFSSLVSQSPSEARLTLFRSESATEPLTPLLIVMAFDTTPTSRVEVVTPDDGPAWTGAKIWVRSFEANATPIKHFVQYHLRHGAFCNAFTMFLGPYGAVSPAHALLEPYCKYANGFVIVGFPALFSTTSTQYPLVANYKEFGMHTGLNAFLSKVGYSDASFMNDVYRRGLHRMPGNLLVDDVGAFRHATLDAFLDILSVSYASDVEVANDAYLQRALTYASTPHPHGGNVWGLDPVDSIERLAEFLTEFHVSSVLHHISNTRAQGDVQEVFPLAPMTIPCPWPGKAQVTNRYLASQCMPPITLISKTIQMADGFNRTCPRSCAYTESMTFFPETIRVGTGSTEKGAAILHHALADWKRALEARDRHILTRERAAAVRHGGILPFTVALSYNMPQNPKV